jgi:lipoate-protein ligase A
VSPVRWRFVQSGACPGVENMALDEALLESHAHQHSPPILRVYTWRPPAVSLGRFQSIESSVDLDACRTLGVDVVRRPTGGRAILHTEEEVTFSIVVSGQQLGTTGIMDSYQALAGGIIRALGILGLVAGLAERSSGSSQRRAGQDPACFAAKARCDVVVGSVKVVGSAQVQREGFILQQNSLPLRMALESWGRVFRRPDEAPAAAGLWEVGKTRPTYAEVAAALRTGFEERFGAQFVDSEVSEHEAARARELAKRAAVLVARPVSV